VGKHVKRDHLENPRPTWDNNNKMDLKETGCMGVDWVSLALDVDKWRALVSMTNNLRVS
jgi:hypothetical protein